MFIFAQIVCDVHKEFGEMGFGVTLEERNAYNRRAEERLRCEGYDEINGVIERGFDVFPHKPLLFESPVNRKVDVILKDIRVSTGL